MNRVVICNFVVLFVLFSLTAVAQPAKIKFRDRLGDTTQLVNTAVKPPKVKLPKALRNEWSIGLRLNTDGYGLLFDFGKAFGSEEFGNNNSAKFFHNHLFQFEISEKKHSKEIRTNNVIGGIALTPSSFIFGKINNFYQAKLGYGQRHMIAGKPDPGTVSIHWVYLGGISAGLLKPYYLNVQGEGLVKYSKENEQYYANPSAILGAGGFGKGWNELKVVPGLHAKTGLHFDFATGRKGKMALEVGANAEYYFSKIQQMYGQKDNNFFFNLYAAIQFGKRS